MAHIFLCLVWWRLNMCSVSMLTLWTCKVWRGLYLLVTCRIERIVRRNDLVLFGWNSTLFPGELTFLALCLPHLFDKFGMDEIST